MIEAVKVTPAERVAAGAELLDRLCPGWADQVDVETLDMSHGGYEPVPEMECGCVLAQLDYGDHVLAREEHGQGVYARGWQQLCQLTGGLVDSYEHGFMAFRNNDDSEQALERGESCPPWRALDEAWADEIRARR